MRNSEFGIRNAELSLCANTVVPLQMWRYHKNPNGHTLIIPNSSFRISNSAFHFVVNLNFMPFSGHPSHFYGIIFFQECA